MELLESQKSSFSFCFGTESVNPDKCSFMLLGVEDELQTNLVCGNETLKNSKQ